MTASRVALIRGEERAHNIRRALEAMGDQIDWRGVRRVLVKPNFVCGDRPLAATHVEGVSVLLGWLRQRTEARIVVGEGSAGCNTWEAFSSYGYMGLPDEFPGVELCDLNDDEPVPVAIFGLGKRVLTVYAARTAMESDCRISIGPPKTHDAVIVTHSLKNMVMGSLIGRTATRPRDLPGDACVAGGSDRAGCRPEQRSLSRIVLAGWRLYGNLPARIRNWSLLELAKAVYMSRSNASSKQRMHQSLKLLNLNLFALAPLLRPHLSIIDGWEGMEGNGPSLGDAVPWRVAIASCDFLAADALAADMMGYPIDGVGYLHYCARGGLGAGRREQMTVVGDVLPEDARREFRPPPGLAVQRRWGIKDAEYWLQAALRLNDGQLPGRKEPSEGTRRSND